MSTRITNNHGVTLIELLVAMTITLVLAGLLLSVTGGTLNLWKGAQNAFTTDTEAKLVLDTLERDLHAALFRANGATWLAVDVISTPALLSSHGWRTTGIIKPSTSESLNVLPPDIASVPSTIADGRFGLSGAWLRFLTTNVEAKGASNPGGSQPTAVSYQIARRPLSGSIAAGNLATVRYTLFRSAVANDTTVTNGLDVLASGYGSSTSGFPAARSARSLTNPNTADAIASNVVDVGVWLYVRNGADELVRIFPATNADIVHTAANVADFPEVMDVMLRVLTEDGAKTIGALESGSAAVVRPVGLTAEQWWWSVAEANSRVYVRRIQVKGGPR
jgi:prepilin-type N-terminal cleavage/methylation domain-containing protein